MSTIDKAPLFVRVANILTITLARSGFKLVGFGKYPMYLLTVRGRKSGQPRTLPIVILQRDGQRYLASPYGQVNWVRNLRAAGEATLTRGRRSETVVATELPIGEAAAVLRDEARDGNPFMRVFGVAADSSAEELERAAAGHPVFLLRSAATPEAEAARHIQRGA